MHTLALNYKNERVRDKVVLFLNNFIGDDIEIVTIENLEDLMQLEEAKKANEKNIPLNKVLKEFDIESTNKQ